MDRSIYYHYGKEETNQTYIKSKLTFNDSK